MKIKIININYYKTYIKIIYGVMTREEILNNCNGQKNVFLSIYGNSDFSKFYKITKEILDSLDEEKNIEHSAVGLEGILVENKEFISQIENDLIRLSDKDFEIKYHIVKPEKELFYGIYVHD